MVSSVVEKRLGALPVAAGLCDQRLHTPFFDNRVIRAASLLPADVRLQPGAQHALLRGARQRRAGWTAWRTWSRSSCGCAASRRGGWQLMDGPADAAAARFA
ncbi:hypothetical protein [Streptomyces sp. NPDC000880]